LKGLGEKIKAKLKGKFGKSKGGEHHEGMPRHGRKRDPASGELVPSFANKRDWTYAMMTRSSPATEGSGDAWPTA